MTVHWELLFTPVVLIDLHHQFNQLFSDLNLSTRTLETSFQSIYDSIFSPKIIDNKVDYSGNNRRRPFGKTMHSKATSRHMWFSEDYDESVATELVCMRWKAYSRMNRTHLPINRRRVYLYNCYDEVDTSKQMTQRKQNATSTPANVNNNVGVELATPVKRKRGRPRKNPLVQANNPPSNLPIAMNSNKDTNDYDNNDNEAGVIFVPEYHLHRIKMSAKRLGRVMQEMRRLALMRNLRSIYRHRPARKH